MISGVIFDDDVECWRRQGYLIIEGLLDSDQIAGAQADLDRLAPTFAQIRDGEAPIPPMRCFPYKARVLDELVFGSRLVDFAERALGSDVVLSHSEILHKYAGTGDFGQDMHQDWGNNSLIVPSERDPDQVASITYLTDVTLDMGPTAVVSLQDGMPWKHQRTLARSDAPDIYDFEHLVDVPAGSTLLYTMRTFHRGTQITATEGCRHSLHVAFQRSSVTWAGWRSIPQEGNSPWIRELLTNLAPSQRSVLGFPKPGDPYWSDETIADVQRRYPDMDLRPYGT